MRVLSLSVHSIILFALRFQSFPLRMPITYVSSGKVYDFCLAISSEDGFFTPDQLAVLNDCTFNFLGITEVRCVSSSTTASPRHDPIYVITNPVGGIPCGTVRRYPRNCPDDESD